MSQRCRYSQDCLTTCVCGWASWPCSSSIWACVPIQPPGWSRRGAASPPGGGVQCLREAVPGTLLLRDAGGSVDLNGRFVALCSHSTCISRLFSHYFFPGNYLQRKAKKASRQQKVPYSFNNSQVNIEIRNHLPWDLWIIWKVRVLTYHVHFYLMLIQLFLGMPSCIQGKLN